ncbi:hypothetical protein COOONC_24237 [Cooperia oncophora]
MLQEALENETYKKRRRNIQFTTICPSFIRTRMATEIPLAPSTEYLSPEVVAEEIVDAILTNKRILLLPKKAYLLYAVKGSSTPNKVCWGGPYTKQWSKDKQLMRTVETSLASTSFCPV